MFILVLIEEDTAEGFEGTLFFCWNLALRTHTYVYICTWLNLRKKGLNSSYCSVYCIKVNNLVFIVLLEKYKPYFLRNIWKVNEQFLTKFFLLSIIYVVVFSSQNWDSYIGNDNYTIAQLKWAVTRRYHYSFKLKFFFVEMFLERFFKEWILKRAIQLNKKSANSTFLSHFYSTLFHPLFRSLIRAPNPK